MKLLRAPSCPRVAPAWEAAGLGPRLAPALCCLLLAACEAPGRQGEPRPESVGGAMEPSRVAPGAPPPVAGEPSLRDASAPSGPPCEALCGARASCLEEFQRLGAPPLLGPALPGEPAGCLERCRAAEKDLTLGPLIPALQRQCLHTPAGSASPRSACDALYGCALRERLRLLAAAPWRRAVLQAREGLGVLEALRKGGDGARAVGRCLEQDGLRAALQALAEGAAAEGKDAAAAAKAALDALDGACRGAVEADLETRAAALERAVKGLRIDDADASCHRLRRLRRVPWRPAGEAAATRIGEAERICATLEALRALATSVADAEADTALVVRELDRGGSGVAAYHKCVHKGATLKALEASEHPRARGAAKALRRACFERFPVEWLRAAQRAGAAPDRAQCFRVRLVLRLLTDHGPPAELLARQDGLLAWARSRCP